MKNIKSEITKSKLGFTLIELLIVIAIIGLISTIVLASLNSSRDKAYESQITQQLSAFRAGAELYFYNQNPNGYTPIVSDGNCDTPGTVFSSFDVNEGKPGSTIDPAVLPAGVQRVCASTARAYAVKISSYVNVDGYWCADSKGVLKFVPGSPLGGPVTACPL